MPLKPEVAQERLEAVKVTNWEPKLHARLKQLPKALASPAFGLIGREASGKNIRDWDKTQEVQEAAVVAIDALTAAQRVKLFAGFFPNLGKHCATAWDLFPRLPYQEYGDRRAFRAPNNPELYYERKGDWFRAVLGEVAEYKPEVITLDWLAAWAPYLGYGGVDEVGLLFAAAIDTGGKEGDEIFNILKASASGQHEIGAMGKHVTRALLVASRKDGWEFMEKMLIAAQRQEGLRQAILETVDEAHPEAFRRMVDLVLDKDLIRFSSVVRAVDVWFGLELDVLSPAKVKKAYRDVANFLKDPKLRKAALAGDDLGSAYLALMTSAFEDIGDAISLAAKLTKDKVSVDRRLLGIHFLESLQTDAAIPHLVPLVDDPDPTVASFALSATRDRDDNKVMAAAPNIFESIERLVNRMPAKMPMIEIPGANVSNSALDRDDAAGLLIDYRGKRPLNRLVPYMKLMDGWHLADLVKEMAKQKTIDDATRTLFFELISHRNDEVREAALKAVRKCNPTPDEVRALEPMLARKKEGTRRGVVSLILKQKAPVVQETAERLLASKNGSVRLAGLEVFRHLASKDKTAEAAKARVTAFRDATKKMTADEKRQVDQILKEKKDRAALVGPDTAFGLADLSKRTFAPKPVARKVKFITPAAIGIFAALDKLVHEHRETSIKYKDYRGEQEQPLGTVHWGFPAPDLTKPREGQEANLPLREVWEKFWENRPKELRDADGLELSRAWALTYLNEWDWRRIQEEGRKGLKKVKDMMFPTDFKYKDPKYERVVETLVQWLHFLHSPPGEIDYMLDGLETVYASVGAENLKAKRKTERRYYELIGFWQQAMRWKDRKTWTPEQRRREWDLIRWWDEPAGPGGMPRQRPDLDTFLAAYANGWADETDLLDLLLGPRGADDLDDFDEDNHNDPLLNARYNELESFTARKPPKEFEQKPELAAMAERIRAHLLDLELARGDLPTPATAAARHLGSLWGSETLFRLFAALAGNNLKKGARWSWTVSNDRSEVLTSLIKKTHPRPDDTPERFAELARAAIGTGTLTEQTLLGLAFSAPQWIPFVEAVLGWPGVAEGVWWFLAHMPGEPDGVEGDDDDDLEFDDEDDFETEDGEPRPEKLSAWEQLIAQRTPLTPAERREGAVDVAWFHRTHALVGEEHWAAIQAAAKLGGSGHDYKKPTVLAEVLLGKAKKADIVNAIAKRRLRESVRLLGLMPLAAGDKREADLRERYEVLQEYAKYARSLGSMSRASAVQAADIGIANLARTAGYPDAIRFQWAMEAESVADLAKGPQVVSVQGYTITLALDEGKPVVTVSKAGKPLKAIPPAIKKLEKVAELTARKQHLTRQASRVRKSLEAMMSRGDEFSGAELGQLMVHPLLSPFLTRLVLVGEGVIGYPVKDGKALEDHAGKLEPVKKGEKLRIAHSADLFATGEWDRWQHDLFARERVQPFKQIYRELYLLTDQERADGNASHRYSGQQVQPRQGAALLNSRGWSTESYTRTFHEAGIRVTFTVKWSGGTALDVEGWTIEDIRFYRRNEWKPMPLAEVPPRVFSEAMRDLDLVVSVAHMGQVDPEASASTVEMRASLLRETTQLLKMSNVRIEKNHAIVDGQLGQYTVHLGSGTVHRMPGGSVCIVPVHAQQRGRLFLPFADDDPRTAEVTSKILLLARDNEIQDPTILQQLLNA